MCAYVEAKCCDFPHLIEVVGCRVCANCGLEDIVPYFEHGKVPLKDQEGRYVWNSDGAGAESFYPHSTISPKNKDYRGQPLPSGADYQFQRLRFIDKHFASNEIRNLVEANRTRHRLMSALGFSDPRKISLSICRWVAQTGFSQGRTLEATTAAAIYVAAKEQDFPITYEQLGKIANVRLSHLRHLVSIYLAGHPIGTRKFPVTLTRQKFFLPNRCIRKLCDDLQYPPRTAMLAEELAQSVEDRSPSGARPMTKAAVFVNAACGGKIPWDHLSRAAGVSVPSLKEYWKKAEPWVNKILGIRSLPKEDSADEADEDSADEA